MPQGKAGLGQHMANLGAAVAGSHIENAANAIQAMVNFKRSQETKFDAIETGYKKFQKTGQPQTIKYGPLKESTFVVKDHKTKGILSHIQKEIKVMDKGIKLSVDLATAHFDPESQRKQKTEQHKVTMDRQPSVGDKVSKPVQTSNTTANTTTPVDTASKYQDMSLSEMRDAGIALNAEIKGLTDPKDATKKEALIKERNSLRQLFNDKAKTNIPSVPKATPTNVETTPDTVVEDVTPKSRIEPTKVLSPEANKSPLNAKAQGALKKITYFGL